MSKETLNYIWGLDLSMSNTGISIFDKIGNPVFIGSIPTNKDFSHGKRLKEIYDYLSLLKDKYYPDILCIERGFNRFNKSSEAIWKVNGVVDLLFNNEEIIFYSPKTIKKMIIMQIVLLKVLNYQVFHLKN